MSAPLVQDIDLTNDPQIRGNKILEDIDRIRDITPAYWSETNRCWLVTRHKDVAAIVRRKRLLLFKEMLSDIHYDDMAVVDLLMDGIKVVGTLPRVGIWKPQDKAAACGEQTLKGRAPQAQKEMMTARPPLPGG